MLKSPERIKKGILQCSDDGYNPTHVQIVLNELSVTTTMKQLKIDQCLIPAKDEKCVPHFTLNSPMYIKQSEKKTRASENLSKSDMLKLFVLLFAPSGVNKKDIEIMKDFLYGQSSPQRFLMWLFQWASFLETKERTESIEMIVKEKEKSFSTSS